MLNSKWVIMDRKKKKKKTKNGKQKQKILPTGDDQHDVRDDRDEIA